MQKRNRSHQLYTQAHSDLPQTIFTSCSYSTSQVLKIGWSWAHVTHLHFKKQRWLISNIHCHYWLYLQQFLSASCAVAAAMLMMIKLLQLLSSVHARTHTQTQHHSSDRQIRGLCVNKGGSNDLVSEHLFCSVNRRTQTHQSNRSFTLFPDFFVISLHFQSTWWRSLAACG